MIRRITTAPACASVFQRAGKLNAGITGYYYYSALAASTDATLSKFLRSGVTWPRQLSTSMDPKTWVMSDVWISGVPTAHAGYRKGVNCDARWQRGFRE